MHDYFNCTAIVDTTGAVQERYGYNGFGQVRFMTAGFGSLTGSSYGWESLFANYRWDGETGFYQVRYRYYHPGLGRWLTRNPLYEPGFELMDEIQLNPRKWSSRDQIEELVVRRRHLKSLSEKDSYAMIGRWPSDNEFAFVHNAPQNKCDMLALCPAGTCDEWTINVILMRGGGVAGPTGLDVRTTLTACPRCSISPTSQYYRYLGYGLGGGVDWAIGFKVGSHTFTTACIPWKAHNGIGRVTGIGGGIIRTYGHYLFHNASGLLFD